MIGNKYKIIQMAKDFGVKSKDLLDILEKSGRPAKNHMATLTPEEFDILVCELSVANQVKKIDGYIYGETMIPRKEPKAEKKAAPRSKQGGDKPKAEKPRAAAAETPAAPAKKHRRRHYGKPRSKQGGEN